MLLEFVISKRNIHSTVTQGENVFSSPAAPLRDGLSCVDVAGDRIPLLEEGFGAVQRAGQTPVGSPPDGKDVQLPQEKDTVAPAEGLCILSTARIYFLPGATSAVCM